jgi:hypothetical protein
LHFLSGADAVLDLYASQMEEHDPNYCTSDGVAMDDDACRAKITEELESNLMTVGVRATTIHQFAFRARDNHSFAALRIVGSCLMGTC